MDIREFARNLVETSGDVEEDSKKYLDLLSKGDRDMIEND